MDFKAKPKDKGANEECLVLPSLKILLIYNMNSGALDGRKKGFNSQSFPNDTTKFLSTKKQANSWLYYSKNNEIAGH